MSHSFRRGFSLTTLVRLLRCGTILTGGLLAHRQARDSKLYDGEEASILLLQWLPLSS